MTNAVIVGAGANGEVYNSYLREAGVQVAGFLDDTDAKQGTSVCGVPVLGKTELIETLSGIDALYAPLGNNRARVKFHTRARRAGLKTPNYIHPSVVISPDVVIGEGVYIKPGSLVQPHVVIDDDVMIAMNVSISHHSHLCAGVFLASGTTVGAKLTIEQCAYVGLGVTIVSDKARTICEDALIGAGSVVLADVEPRTVVAGVPARVRRRI